MRHDEKMKGGAAPGADVWERNWRLWLLALFVLAFALRAYVVARYPTVPIADAAQYQQLATDLAAGKGFVYEGTDHPTAFRPIGYPAFVAAVYAVFGPDPRAAYWFHALLGAVNVLLVVLLGRLMLGRREALLAGLLAAVYPGYVWLSRVLLSENLALPLLVGGLYAAALLLRAERRRPAWAALLGVVLGVGVLVRSNNMLIVVLMLLWLAYTFWKRGEGLRRALLWPAVAAAAFVLVLMPWEVRNYHVFGRVVPLTTNDGITLYGAYWPPQVGSKRIYGNIPGLEDPVVAASVREGDEPAISAYLRRVTWERLRANPGFYFRLLPEKLFYMVVPVDWETFPHAPGESRSLNPVYALACLLALFGCWALVRGRRLPYQWLLWPLPISVLVQTLVFYGGPRYRLPAEFTVILLAPVGLTWLAGALRLGARRGGVRELARAESAGGGK
ncbi:MAG TPA: glycosyltransferase family 39 protein [Pyrinomonadaceae bacterium]|nr:glycosyltransferase family 39 protein [Pyrinomonadaceae bacterium]